MGKVFFILNVIFVMNISSCFSQLLISDKKEYNSVMRYVYGYSNDFNELDLGIAFGKVVNSGDTTYYIKLQLCAPKSDFRDDILLKRSSTITFLSKNGKSIDLKLSDVISSTKKVNTNQMDYPLATVNTFFTTNLILYVTKNQLIEIGSEPFYNLIIPYFNNSTKVENKAEFTKPTLFVRRSFIQAQIKYILDI
jgi:hypothetical protein